MQSNKKLVSVIIIILMQSLFESYKKDKILIFNEN